MITLILVFIKISFLGFGGGYAMLSLIFSEATSLGITTQQFVDLNALDLLAPGPIAVNSATYVGYTTNGILGALFATLAVSTASLVFSSILIHYEESFSKNIYISTCLNYVKIASIGMIASVAFSLLYQSLVNNDTYIISIPAIMLASLLRFKFKMNTLLVLLFVGISGAFLYVII